MAPITELKINVGFRDAFEAEVQAASNSIRRLGSNASLITLTHPLGDGPPEYRKYSGRVLLDARAIQSIEEILVEGEEPLSYVTLRGGCSYRVAESVEQITSRMAEALGVPAVAFS